MGALVGFVGGMLMHSQGRIVLIENVLVGGFGGVLGGEFIVAMTTSGLVDPNVFSGRSLAIAMVSATVMVFMLRLMRLAVGPLAASRGKRRR